MRGNERQRRRVGALLERHGLSYSGELKLDLAKNTPSPLFRWLCASLLLSAPISADQALKAARALAEHGWTTARKMAGATWEQRTHALNRSGYARYDESTSRMLGETAAMLVGEYGGDLRKLRAKANEDPRAERRLLRECKGIGDVGADIFFREVQVAWTELYPFADDRARAAAKRLDLPASAAGLSELVGRADFPRLLAALVRADLGNDLDEIKQVS